MIKEKTDPDFWREVKLGQAIELRDLLTLKDAIERGKPSGSLFYTVASIRTIKEMSGICEWLLFELKDFDDVRDLLLMVKIADRAFDVRVYYQAPDEHLTPGSREDLATSWIWEDTGVGLSGLKYIDRLDRAYDSDRAALDVDTFFKKGKRDFQGTCVTDPQPSGLDRELLATVAEYSVGVSIAPYHPSHDDKEALILELSSKESEDGGFITLYWGSSLSLGDIDVEKL